MPEAFDMHVLENYMHRMQHAFIITVEAMEMFMEEYKHVSCTSAPRVKRFSMLCHYLHRRRRHNRRHHHRVLQLLSMMNMNVYSGMALHSIA